MAASQGHQPPEKEAGRLPGGGGLEDWGACQQEELNLGRGTGNDAVKEEIWKSVGHFWEGQAAVCRRPPESM